MSRQSPTHNIMSAQAANGAGSEMNIGGMEGLVLELSTSGFTGTLKFLVSKRSTPVADWTVTPAIANGLSYVLLIAEKDGVTLIDGDTGLVIATDTRSEGFKVNIEGAVAFNVVMTNRSAGSVTINAYAKHQGRNR